MERLRAERLQQARNSLVKQVFDDAIQTLETQSREGGDDSEGQDLLVRARSEQADAVQAALLRPEQEAGLDARVSILEEASRMSSRDGPRKEHLHQDRQTNH